MLSLHIFASGSGGNAAVVVDRATGDAVAIDCGVCAKDWMAGADAAGLDPSAIRALLITHEHTDHTKGIGVVTRRWAKLAAKRAAAEAAACAAGDGGTWAAAGAAVRDAAVTEGAADGGVAVTEGAAAGSALAAAPPAQAPALYALPSVAYNSKEIRDFAAAGGLLRELQPGCWLQLGSIRVEPFRTSHDTLESCGFRFTAADGDTLGYVTDTGYLPPEALSALSRVRLLALESNHDVDMLANGPYPMWLKLRVGSDHGHLSNAQAAAALEQLLWPGLEQVVAMHISQHNNTYLLPAETLRRVVAAAGHAATVRVAYQERFVSVE